VGSNDSVKHMLCARVIDCMTSVGIQGQAVIMNEMLPGEGRIWRLILSKSENLLRSESSFLIEG